MIVPPRSLPILAVLVALGASVPRTLFGQSCATSISSAGSSSREDADRDAQQLIADARRFSNDFDKCRTLAQAIDRTRSATTASALFAAASTLRGEFELAEVLVSASGRGLLEERTAAAFLSAAAQLESDYQLQRVLSAALRIAARTPALVPGILRASSTIEDDYQLASLLIDVAATVPVAGATRDLYISAARTLQNEWEYRRAMDALERQRVRTTG